MQRLSQMQQRNAKKRPPLCRLPKVAAPNWQQLRANQVPSRRFVYIGAVLGQLTIVIGARSKTAAYSCCRRGLDTCLGSSSDDGDDVSEPRNERCRVQNDNKRSASPDIDAPPSPCLVLTGQRVNSGHHSQWRSEALDAAESLFLCRARCYAARIAANEPA
ncbi:hypothetical protein HDV63DRAFT_5758 [Trichoderma sp. SZMC 28014]